MVIALSIGGHSRIWIDFQVLFICGGTGFKKMKLTVIAAKTPKNAEIRAYFRLLAARPKRFSRPDIDL